MDVILFLLKMITQLALALTGATVAVITWTLGKFTQRVVTKAQPQQEQQARSTPARTKQETAPSQPQQTQPSGSPEVHVHIHINQQATPSAASEPAAVAGPTLEPAPSARDRPPSHVLNRPDHRIYATSGSHFMREHPDCDALLEQLDHMLYLAAHRDGAPYKFGPFLDDSPATSPVARELPAPLLPEAGEFLSEEGRPLPPADGALWLRREGRIPERLPAGSLS